MVKAIVSLAALASIASAWPTAMRMDELVKRAGSTGRLNTGAGHPNPTFDAQAQYVDVTEGSGNEYQDPKSTDLRGQCPGLNAAANHNFLPRNGIASIAQTVTGMGALYNMSPELAAALAAIAVLLCGDIPTTTWSIGGAYPASLPALGTPYGLLGTHDEYENDASVARGDAYLNNGDVNVFQMFAWNNMYSLVGDNLDLDKGTSHSNFVTEYSINNNPYAFWGPFSGLVAPAAMNFVVNFMSNHSAEAPGGTLNTDVLKQFFSVTGEPGSFVYTAGKERVPENWYKRPGGVDAYNAPDVFLDLLAGASIYPGTLRFGGNTGTTNSFTGVDLSDFTGGVYNAQTLFQGNNLACYAIQYAAAARVAQLDPLASTLTNTLDEVLKPISAATSELSCPQLAPTFNYALLEKYPGYKYSNHLASA